jgi:hypothetical protein
MRAQLSHQSTTILRVLLCALVCGLCACGSSGTGANGAGANTDDEDATSTADSISAKDGGAVDSKGGDGGGTAGGDGQSTPKGCMGDQDCAGLQLTTCQKVQCNLASGLCEVSALAEGTPCPGLDADLCKQGAVCKGGACAYTLKSCDDGNPCTDDSCLPGSGCVSAAVSTLCSDGNPCTQLAKCVDGACVAQSQISCDDGLPCTEDGCDKTSGCIHKTLADGGACSDGKVCTEADACKGGQCVGTEKACTDDGNPCTLAKCAEQTGGQCGQALLTGTVCDDGKPCTFNDQCDPSGSCSGQTDPAACDDKNPCTQDSCDPTAGCLNTAIDGPCPATDNCTGAGVCEAGVCKGAVKNCDDGNACTDDSCDKALGCQSKANTAPCFDGDACSSGDTCSAGVCKGKAIDCSDGNPCTADACDGKIGCNHPPLPLGSGCGSGKQCVAGLCVPNANACGDGWCAIAEDSQTCPGDCPEGGGACSPNDGICLVKCQGKSCAAVYETCVATKGCLDIGGCIGACMDDVSCQLGCVLSAGLPAFEAFVARDRCMQAFCLQDSWIGKGCSGGGQQYVQCVETCEGSMCKLLSLKCKVSAGCQVVRACMQACPVNDPATLACVQDCKTKGTAEDFETNGDLDKCSTQHCQ